MNKIIIINGKGECGKSTFVSFCHEISPNVVETSTIDFVKEIAAKAGWDGKKDIKGRKLLSDLKAALESYDNIPNKKIEEYIHNHPEQIIFVNIREPKNIEYFVKKYNAITLLIRRHQTDTKIYYNSSDDNVDNFSYDFIYKNFGDLSDMKLYAKEFLSKIL